MSDLLLPYYHKELSYIRRLAADFAKAHPKIASRLRLGAGASQDPHVERLVEAFAYLTARIRHKLEDDFPEITEAILGVLYPHFLAPIPSMAVAKFTLSAGQNELTQGFMLPRGTALESEPIQGEPCRFRTAYPVTIWPIDIKTANLSRPPFIAPDNPRSSDTAAVLRVLLRTRDPAVRFGSFPLSSLRFFLQGQPPDVFKLYELIFNNTLTVALANNPRDANPIILDRDCVRPVGFDRTEGMLPYSPRSFAGYGLLTEFFVFPEKFLFVDIAGIEANAWSQIGNQLEIYFYLNESAPDLENSVTAETFQLGCTPVVNLFRQKAEPIPLTHADFEYRVVPDARRPLAMEVYSVDGVAATSPGGEQMQFEPFYSAKHAADRTTHGKFWYPSRRASEHAEGKTDYGTEVYLSLVDLEFKPSAPAQWTLDIDTTCLNRDLPFDLPFGGGQPFLHLSEGGGGVVDTIHCLTHPTRTFRPARKHGAQWYLISHLSLNHLSLADQYEGADALREILRLYNFADSDETNAMIDGILHIQTRRVVGRAREGGAAAFCRGLEVVVQFSEERFAGSGGLFLFASVLERFLGLYCSINSFTRLIATTQESDGELRRWPPRAGEKVLL